MTAIVIKWIIVFIAFMNFGYMLFDGGRALLKGDYIRPESGTHAGKLGPWSKLVIKIGLDPESNLMKSIFLLWGITGLVITACYIFNISWAWKAMIAINIFSLWYLIPGTINSMLQIILLLVSR